MDTERQNTLTLKSVSWRRIHATGIPINELTKKVKRKLCVCVCGPNNFFAFASSFVSPHVAPCLSKSFVVTWFQVILVPTFCVRNLFFSLVLSQPFAVLIFHKLNYLASTNSSTSCIFSNNQTFHSVLGNSYDSSPPQPVLCSFNSHRNVIIELKIVLITIDFVSFSFPACLWNFYSNHLQF